MPQKQVQGVGRRTEGGPGRFVIILYYIRRVHVVPVELHSGQFCEPGEALCKVQPLRRVFKAQPKRSQPLKDQHL